MTDLRTGPDRIEQTVIYIVGGAAAAMSFSGLSGLAEIAGYTGHAAIPGPELTVRQSWLLPITVDAYALVATRIWHRAPKRTRSYAQWSALAAIALSIAGNGLYHGLNAGGPVWMVVIAVLVGAVAPLLLGLTVHLKVRRSDDKNGQAPPPDRASKRARSKRVQSGPDDQTALELIRKAHPDRTPSRRKIQKLLGCGSPRGKRLRELLEATA